ncbi:efflux RND transporter permease subunit, partial [Pseudomonas sp. SB113]|uniref:efflux RND transporter permease subunit n=1 Tax=Pseudomonas sp. SB113 TaxID=3154123 RepID=UPI00345C8C48
AASQNAIGTGVMGGMISATVLAIFFVPVFYVLVMKLFGHGKEKAQASDPASVPAE